MIGVDDSIESGTGKFTLPDLILLVANGWALPMAVQDHIARDSAWVWLAFPLAAVAAFAFAWRWKKLEWRLCRQFISAETAAELTRRDLTIIRRIFIIVLLGSLLLQLALYWAAAVLIRIVSS